MIVRRFLTRWGGGGVLVRNKRVDYIGELVNIVAHDKKLKENIIEGQRRQLEKFKKEKREKFLLKIIKKM